MNKPIALASAIAIVLIASATLARPVHAHGFGPRYDLPIPLGFYLFGAAAAVALSFVIIGFGGDWSGAVTYPRWNLLRFRPLAFLAPALAWALRAIGIGCLAAVFVGGFAGNQRSPVNAAPILTWVVFWVGVSYTSALIGNVWALANPWKAIADLTTAAGRAAGVGQRRGPPLDYPRRIGTWPAAAAFLVFAWFESAYAASGNPRAIAVAAAVYSVFTLSGIALFGRHVWLRNAEVFTFLFGLLTRFAPIEIAVSNASQCRSCTTECFGGESCIGCVECFEAAPAAERQVNVRPLAVGLAGRLRTTTSDATIIMMLLATVTFDGFKATPLWSSFYATVRPTFGAFGQFEPTAISSAGLLLMVLAFAGVFMCFAGLMSVVTGGRLPGLHLVRRFAITLVPIAIAYHLAHYFLFLFAQGQWLIPLLSDPFARGWDMVGTASVIPNIGLINARYAWLFAVGAVVFGHVVAVFLAHHHAIGVFRSRRTALASQYPMLVLMIAYTMSSLWILAQPITGSE